jgi:hypothetical protein
MNIEVIFRSSDFANFSGNTFVSYDDTQVKLKYVVQGVSFTEELDGNLASCTAMYLSSTDARIPQYTYAKVKIDDAIKYYLVAKDIPDRQSPFHSGFKYVHTLVLAEPTIYLEKITMSADAFTRKINIENQACSLYDQLIEALDKAMGPRLDPNADRFTLSASLINLTKDVPAEEFFFDTPPLLREVLDEMLRVVGARSKIESIDNFNAIEITYHTFETTESEATLDNISAINVTPDFDLLTRDFEVYGVNGMSSNRIEITSDWDTFKAIDGNATLTTNNSGIVTAHPVEKFTSFKLKAQWCINVDLLTGLYDNLGRTIGGGVADFIGIFSGSAKTAVTNWVSNNFNNANNPIIDLPDLELINYLYDVDEYNRLSDTDKLHALCYERGSQTVSVGSYTTVVFMPLASLTYVIKEALVDQYGALSSSSPYYNTVRDIISFYNSLSTWVESLANTIVTLGGLLDAGDTSTAFNLAKMIYKVSYVPYYDIHAKFSKDNALNSLPATSQFDNQSEKSIDVLRYGDIAKKKANAVGNNVVPISLLADSYSDLIPVGRVLNDSLTLVSREYSIYANHVEVAYKFEADYKVNRGRASIDRTRRIYEIPLATDQLDRNILIRNYILIDDEEIANDNIVLKHSVVKDIAGSFNKASASEVVNAAIVKTFSSEYKSGRTDTIPGPYQMGIARYTMATSMLFTFKFYDNYSAGLGNGSKVVGGRKVMLNRYVNKIDGRYDKIRIALSRGRFDNYDTRDHYLTILNNLPLISSRLYSDSSNGGNGLYYYLVSEENVYYLPKDAFTRDIFTMQYEFVSNIVDRIFISNKIAEICCLIKSEVVTTKIYTSTDLYTKGCTKALGSINTSVTLTTNIDNTDKVYLKLSGLSSSINSWCIADTKGNIILAYNRKTVSNTEDKIYFASSRIRSYQEEIATTTGYSVTYAMSNNSTFPGTIPSAIHDQVALPDPLPVLTANGYTFYGWYYNLSYTRRAFAGDVLSSNVTLYGRVIRNDIIAI